MRERKKGISYVPHLTLIPEGEGILPTLPNAKIRAEQYRLPKGEGITGHPTA